MALMLEVFCSMCGKNIPCKFDVSETMDFDKQLIKKRIEEEGWIVQFNGEHIDTYCSASCAE